MYTRIYAIYDKKAQSIIGGLQLHKHDAAAIRLFSEYAKDPQTVLHKYLADFVLLHLGTLADGNEHEHPYIEHTHRDEIIITGIQLLATLNQPENNP